jgi:acetyl/propionyl-CoA carboxylase alpha subunit
MFQVNIEDQTFEVAAGAAEQLDIVRQADGTIHLLKGGKAYKAELVKADFEKKTFLLRINGDDYHLQIKDELDQLVDRMGLSAGKAKKIKDIKAPMPGLIIDVAVREGQAVSQGDPLLILEAMKMENVLKAEGEGVVKEIKARKGDTVDKGQLIIVMA